MKNNQAILSHCVAQWFEWQQFESQLGKDKRLEINSNCQFAWVVVKWSAFSPSNPTI